MEPGVDFVGDDSPHRPAICASAHSSIAMLEREKLGQRKALATVQLGRFLKRDPAESTRSTYAHKCSMLMKLLGEYLLGNPVLLLHMLAPRLDVHDGGLHILPST